MLVEQRNQWPRPFHKFYVDGIPEESLKVVILLHYFEDKLLLGKKKSLLKLAHRLSIKVFAQNHQRFYFLLQKRTIKKHFC